MNERIKELRKSLNLTLEAFGARIGITLAAVSNIEKGRSNPSNQVIMAICREFRVRESWLRNGDGEMTEQLDEDQELVEFMTSLLNDCPDSFRRRFITVVSKLDENGWNVLEQIANHLTGQETDP